MKGEGAACACGQARFALSWVDENVLEVRAAPVGRPYNFQGEPCCAGGVLLVTYRAGQGATSAQWYNLLGRVLALRTRWEGEAGAGVLADAGPEGSGGAAREQVNR